MGKAIIATFAFDVDCSFYFGSLKVDRSLIVDKIQNEIEDQLALDTTILRKYFDSEDDSVILKA